MDTDALQILRLKNLYYLGAHAQVVSESSNPAFQPRSPQGQLEKKLYVYKSHIALGNYQVPLTELAGSVGLADQQPEFFAVFLLARALSVLPPSFSLSNSTTAQLPPQLTDIVNTMKQFWESHMNNPHVCVAAATLLCTLGDVDGALKCVVFQRKNLECIAMTTQLFLQLNRPDLATNLVESTKQLSDDATLYQLAESWANLYSGAGPRLNDSFYVYEELASSSASASGAAVVVTNGLSVVAMLMGRWEEAERRLTESIAKTPNDAETLVNLITISQVLNRSSEMVQRYLSQLRIVAPNHVYLRDLATKEELFDRCAARYSGVSA